MSSRISRAVWCSIKEQHNTAHKEDCSKHQKTMAAARRRITPIAVDQPVAPTLVLGAEVPLDVGPAPDQGDTKAIHATLGAGRRVWVDIQDTWQLKFKQVSLAWPVLQVCV